MKDGNIKTFATVESFSGFQRIKILVAVDADNSVMINLNSLLIDELEKSKEYSRLRRQFIEALKHTVFTLNRLPE